MIFAAIMVAAVVSAMALMRAVVIAVVVAVTDNAVSLPRTCDASAPPAPAVPVACFDG